MNTTDTPPTKRKRLAFACNYCRSRKTRCDERQPSCTACLVAGMECITTDKRRPGVRVRSRRRIAPAPSSYQHLSRQPVISTPSPRAQAQLFNPEPAGMASPTTANTAQTPHHSPGSPGHEHGNSTRSTKTNETASLRGPCSPYCPQAHVQTPRSTQERYTGRLPMMPLFSGTSTLQLMTNWLGLAFCRLGVHESSFGARSSFILPGPDTNNSASSSLLPSLEPPDLPLPDEATDCLSRYMSHIHPIFPSPAPSVLELIHTTMFSGTDPPKSLLASQEPPIQALYYLTLFFGLPLSPNTGPRKTSFIAYASTLLGHLIGHRSLRSVQAIFLLSLALRESDRISEASDVLKIAISMAQSMGIEREQPTSETSTPPEGRQTWWCIFVLEKILVFDTGQPSTIRELGPEPRGECDDPGQDELYFHAVVGFARTLHEINEQSLRAWKKEESQRLPAEEAIRHKLQTAGRLVIIVDEWVRGLSGDQQLLTPTSPTTNIPRRAFLTAQYYYMLILLHRTTLLVDQKDLLHASELYGANQPWQDLIRSAPTTCVEAARDLIKLLVHLEEIGASSSIIAINAPLAAAYVLSVRIIKGPGLRLNRADFELMKIGIDYAKERYEVYNNDGRLKVIAGCLEEYLFPCLETGGQEAQETAASASRITLTEQPSLPMAWLFPEESGSQMLPSAGAQAMDWAGWSWGDLTDIFNQGE